MSEAIDTFTSTFQAVQDFWVSLPVQQRSAIALVAGVILVLLALRKTVETEGWFLFYGFSGLICLAYAAGLVMSHAG